MSLRRVRGLLLLAALIALLLAIAPAVNAKMVDSFEWEFSESGSFDDCGFVIESEFEISGRTWIRADGKEGTSQAFFGNTKVEHREVLTNLETRDWFVIRGHSLFKDVKATHVEGDVYRFRQHEAGQPFVVEDSTGKVVLRDRGLLVWDQLFDTLGDDVPGGEELSTELAGVHGPHPGLFLEDENFCALAQQLIG